MRSVSLPSGRCWRPVVAGLGAISAQIAGGDRQGPSLGAAGPGVEHHGDWSKAEVGVRKVVAVSAIVPGHCRTDIAEASPEGGAR